jgi:signal transduction histidine kinase
MNTCKILVIDDNEQDQKIIHRYLQKAGYQKIVIADSGEKGVHSALVESPDIILIDTLLPGIDGFETCHQIKQINKCSAQVVMMTGRMDAVDADKARLMGADDYCVKTSDCAAVLEAVHHVCQGFGSQESPLAETRPIAPVDESNNEQIYSEWGLEKTNQAIKALYRELEKKNEELKELDNLKSEFVSTVSHELRTPLTIIKGAIGQVLDGIYGDIKPEQRDKLAMALKGTNLLQRIIDDLLDIAKLEAKKVRLNKNLFDMNDMVLEVQNSFLALAAKKGLSIRTSFSKTQIAIWADRDRIIQVLTNLVSNAIKFTEQGCIDIRIDDFGDHVLCSVKDTGRGIAEDDLPKVFDRFQQFGKSYAPGQEGTGLGLSIAKYLVELHKGTISVNSELGVGSSFFFTLPREIPGSEAKVIK